MISIFRDKRLNSLLNFTTFHYENRNNINDNINTFKFELEEPLYLELENIMDFELDEIMHELTNSDHDHDNPYNIYDIK